MRTEAVHIPVLTLMVATHALALTEATSWVQMERLVMVWVQVKLYNMMYGIWSCAFSSLWPDCLFKPCCSAHLPQMFTNHCLGNIVCL